MLAVESTKAEEVLTYLNLASFFVPLESFQYPQPLGSFASLGLYFLHFSQTIVEEWELFQALFPSLQLSISDLLADLTFQTFILNMKKNTFRAHHGSLPHHVHLRCLWLHSKMFRNSLAHRVLLLGKRWIRLFIRLFS